MGLVLRKIPMEVPDIEKLNLPPVCKVLAMKPRGLVLVTGPTGSGKSTTLAAMIDFRNRSERGHILTMEDPIEFVHNDKMSFVNQREIGGDTASFSGALKRALRQDPDVILVGELRDLETVALAITARKPAPCVWHASHHRAIKTVDRIIDVFSPEQQQQVRMQLSGALQGVISQVLVPKKGGGRVAAFEIMIAIDAIRANIREGKTAQMLNVLQTGSRYGMQLLDLTLTKLVQSGQVELEDALAKANSPDSIKRAVSGGGSADTMIGSAKYKVKRTK
jgi:twitching motility protein PilT